MNFPIITIQQMTQIPIITETTTSIPLPIQKQAQLKKLRRKIKKLKSKRSGEMDQIKKKLIMSKDGLNQAQKIIEGHNWVTTKQKGIQNLSQYLNQQKCSQSTKSYSQIQISEENKGISEYWKKVLMSSHGEALKKHDLDLLEFVNQISVKEYNNKKIVLNFGIREGHPFIFAGNYEKSIILNSEGNPVAYSGEAVSNSYKLKKGLMKLLLTPTSNPQNLIILKQFFDLAAIEIIPKSLTYYLNTRIQEAPQISENCWIMNQRQMQNKESIYTRCETK